MSSGRKVRKDEETCVKRRVVLQGRGMDRKKQRAIRGREAL